MLGWGGLLPHYMQAQSGHWEHWEHWEFPHRSHKHADSMQTRKKEKNCVCVGKHEMFMHFSNRSQLKSLRATRASS